MNAFTNVRRQIVLPALLFYLLVMAAVIWGVYLLQIHNIKTQTSELLRSVEKVYFTTLFHDIQKMDVILGYIKEDPRIREAWIKRDRDALLRLTHPLYRAVKDEHQLTHLYFIGTDRRVFLRVHNPAVYGDVIGRFTLMQAEHSQRRSIGLEYGIYHDLTLRNVQPWYIDGEFVGYVETGEEIAYLTRDIADLTGTEIFVTLKKSLYDKERWQQGIDLYKLKANWDRFENSVIIGQTMEELPESLEAYIDPEGDTKASDLFQATINGRNYFGGYIDIYSVEGTLTGKMVVLDDVTAQIDGMKLLIGALMASGLLLFGAFVYGYYRHVKNIEMRMQRYITQIEFNYDFEQYLNKVSNALFLDDDLDRAIDATLRDLGRTLHAHRAYLFAFKAEYSLMDNTHEWCADGVTPQKALLQEIATGEISWWMQQCLELRPIVISNLDDLPPEALHERLSLEDQGIRSLLVYPVAPGGTLRGFVGIDMVLHRIEWTSTHHLFLKVTANTIAESWEKRDAQEQLRHSYRDILLTLETASNGIFVIDETGTVRLHNQKFLAMWKLDALQPGSTLPQLFERLSRRLKSPEVCFQRMHRLLQDQNSEEFYTLALSDGAIFEVHSVPQFEAEHYRGRSFSFRDITSRVRNEEELTLASQVFEHSLEGIIITDAETRILRANRAFSDLTGYGIEELIGNRPTLLRSHWHDELFYRNVWKALQGEGVWEGEIYDRRKSGELYISLSTIIAVTGKEGDVHHYIGISRDITRLKEAQQNVERLAYYDPLTNLPNRSLFYDRLEQALKDARRNRSRCALLFIDLDNFKQVNDTLGHQGGDRLLQNVADLLTGAVRQNDTVSRLSGDEFTIILKEIGAREDVAEVAEKIVGALRRPMTIDGREVQVGSSIGIALFPDDAKESQTLIHDADAAMYRAKNGGKNRFAFYSPE